MDGAAPRSSAIDPPTVPSISPRPIDYFPPIFPIEVAVITLLSLVPRWLVGAAVALVLISGSPNGALGQDAAGAAEGVARAAADGEPLALLLVRLVPAAPGGAAPRGVVTDEQGRFRFEGVPAGEYRLHIEQIGYERTQSPVLRVGPGETVFRELRGSATPVLLEAITVRGGRCLTVDQVAEDPELAALWGEAKKGLDTRRAYELQFRYHRVMTQDIQTRWRIRGTTHRRLVDTMVNDPDSVLVRDERRRERYRAEGYQNGGQLRLPWEKDLLNDDFLRDHCLDPSFEEAEGAFVLRFRPVRPRRDGAGIRGAITIDASSYLIRKLEVDYLAGDRPFGGSSIVYEDLPVAGGTLRLPARGAATVRARGVGRLAATSAMGTFSFVYDGFERVGSE